MTKLRILMVIGALDYCNGITAYALNYYSRLDPKKYHIDFAVHYDFDTEYKNRLLANGSNVFFMGDFSIKSMLGLSKRIRALYREHPYDIVHCHILNVAPFYFKEAIKAHIPVRIIHSHATKNSDNPLKNIRNSIFKKMALRTCTNRFACSKLAGDYLFKNNYTVVANAIDYQRFQYSLDKRNDLIQQHGLSQDKLILGFIGRFTEQKNLPFLLNVLLGLKSRGKANYHAFIIGDGHLGSFISSFINEHNLGECVQIVPAQPDVSAYYSLFDILLLPSLFEGLPVTGVEAQVAGCDVFCADTISEELNFSGRCRYLPIDDVAPWIEAIETFEKPRTRELPGPEYDLDAQANRLDALYHDLMERKA